MQIFGALNLAGPPAILIVVTLLLRAEFLSRCLALVEGRRRSDSTRRVIKVAVASARWRPLPKPIRPGLVACHPRCYTPPIVAYVPPVASSSSSRAPWSTTRGTLL